MKEEFEREMLEKIDRRKKTKSLERKTCGSNLSHRILIAHKCSKS